MLTLHRFSWALSTCTSPGLQDAVWEGKRPALTLPFVPEGPFKLVPVPSSTQDPWHERGWEP